ncbi:hypothetical protein [Oecophyllibacter saccharovorans]|uniref:Uncharacterized protein n=1 Tax=Oecophyllibacter saccharovorans TaxID=2558360 RepID=A0A506UM23_9PROT|nr:hypothetical protein [Oecophyllibacter saccharovorans]TPW34391.1 hypothetical protein E3202_07860 [Oecophyllibacter saccharovorans]
MTHLPTPTPQPAPPSPSSPRLWGRRILGWLAQPTTQISLSMLIGAVAGDYWDVIDSNLASTLALAALPGLLSCGLDRRHVDARTMSLTQGAVVAAMHSLAHHGRGALPPTGQYDLGQTQETPHHEP